MKHENNDMVIRETDAISTVIEIQNKNNNFYMLNEGNPSIYYSYNISL